MSLGGNEVAAAPVIAERGGRAAVSQAERTEWFKTPPTGRSEAASSSQTSTTSNSNELTVFDSIPPPFSFHFTLTFHSNHGSLCFQAPFRPLWQEGDAYVVAYSCHIVTFRLTYARFLQEF